MSIVFMEISEKDKIHLRLLQQQQNDDIPSGIADFIEINSALIKIIDGIHDAQIELPKTHVYFETHLIKLALLNSSLIKEFEGVGFFPTDGNSQNLTYNISAVYLLGRAQIETYFLIRYLYFNPVSYDQSVFRYLLYEFSGLSIRQDFPTVTESSQKKKIEEFKLIGILENKIKSNSWFLSLHSKKQKDILNSKRAKEINWPEIITESGLNISFYHRTWKFYSNYAHSEQIEAMQLKNYYTDNKSLKSHLYLALNCSVIYGAMLIHDLLNQFNSLNKSFNNLSVDTRAKIDFWKSMGQKIKI